AYGGAPGRRTIARPSFKVPQGEEVDSMAEENEGTTRPRFARTRKATLWYLSALRFFYFQFPVTVVWATGLVFTVRVFQNYTKDTTNISNAAFAIVATLAT